MNNREMVPALTALYRMTLIGPMIAQKPEERSIQIKKLIKRAKKEGEIYLTLESSIDAKNYGETLLHRAAYNNDTEMVRALVESKCDVDCQSTLYDTALSLAVCKNHVNIVAILIEAKCNLNLQYPRGHNHVLTYSAFHNHKEIVQMLIEAKCELNHRDNFGGHTALMWAMYKKHLTIAYQLIIAGANIHYTSSHGFAAFDYALQHEDLFTLALLLTHGAQITSPQILFSFLTKCDQNNDDYWTCLRALHTQQKNLCEAKLSDDKNLLLNKETFQQISSMLNEREKYGERVYELIKESTPLPNELNHMIHEYDSPFAGPLHFFKKQNKLTPPLMDAIGNKPACCLIC